MSRSRILGVFFRYWRALFRGSHAVADLLYWPFVDILLWGLTSVWIQQQQNVPQLPLILMTGLIFWHIAWRGSIDIPSNLLLEFWNRNLVNLFSTPLKISEWGLGVILLCLVKLCITITYGALCVYILYALNVFTVGWAFLPFAASLLVFGWSVGFLAASLIIYCGQRFEAFAWMFAFIFAPFSGVFYPVAVLPAWAQVLSWSLPTTYIFEGMRIVLMGGAFPFGYLASSAALNVLYLGLAFSIFRFAFEKSRVKGLARFE